MIGRGIPGNLAIGKDEPVTTVTAVAPGRVNLIGEHTDYNAGLCLPFAIGLTTTATLSTRADDGVHITSDQGEPWTGTLADVDARQVRGWAAYVAGVLWALDHRGPGLDIALSSTIPLGGGLSSSAALECSVAVALTALTGKPLDDDRRRILAEACRRAETEYVGAPTGGVDQLASLLGTEGHGVLIDFAEPRRPHVTSVPLGLAAAGLAILVTDTGVRHSLADGDGGYAERRAQCEAFAADPDTTDPVLVARGRHVRTENLRVRDTVTALGAGDWPRVGTLMSASHASLRDDFEVSVPEVDVAVAAAVDAGALGARITGGGFGGCTIALVHATEVERAQERIDGAYADRRWPAPTHHVVQPEDGARVVDRRETLDT